MQASQSNNASGRHGLASPLTAPIQAARKYLERHREAVPEAQTGECVGDPAGNESGVKAGVNSGVKSRVEPGVEHVVEPRIRPRTYPGIQFGALAQAGVEDRAGRALHGDRAFEAGPRGETGYAGLQGANFAREGLHDGSLADGTPKHADLEDWREDERRRSRGFDWPPRESSFGSASDLTSAVPNPEAVRAAIFRLTRESQWTQHILASGLPAGAAIETVAEIAGDSSTEEESPWKDSIGMEIASRAGGWGIEPSGAKPGVILPSSNSDDATPEARLASQPGIESRSAPMAFEDVALWVWKDTLEGGSEPARTALITGEADVRLSDCDAQAPMAETDVLPEGPHGIRLQSAAQPATLVGEDVAGAEELAAKLSDVSSEELREGPGGLAAERLDHAESVVRVAQPVVPRQPSVAEGPALAHDAGNLLSALGLYSELLSLSGVLQASHRHYAEDLKLLVGRSQVLIERLVRLGRTSEISETLNGVLGQAEEWPDELVATDKVQDPGALECSRSGDATLEADPPNGISLTESVTTPVDSLSPAAGDATMHAPVSLAGEEIGEVSAQAETAQACLAGELALGHENVQERTPGARSELRPEAGLQLQSRSGSRNWRGMPNRPAGRLRAGVSGRPGADAKPGPRERVPARTSLAELLSRWNSLLSTIAHGAMTLEFGPDSGCPVAVPLESLERIVVNLVRNATEAIQDGGAIRIGVGVFDRGGPGSLGRLADRRMVLRVDDSGCGMTEERLRLVAGGLDGAEPSTRSDVRPGGLRGHGRSENHGFERAGGCNIDGGPRMSNVAHSEGRRRGLGLRIVRELVAASGGEIFLQSHPGKGTRIEIQWPVVEGPEVSRFQRADATLSVLGRRSAGTASRLAATALRLAPRTTDRIASPAASPGDATYRMEGPDDQGAIAC